MSGGVQDWAAGACGQRKSLDTLHTREENQLQDPVMEVWRELIMEVVDMNGNFISSDTRRKKSMRRVVKQWYKGPKRLFECNSWRYSRLSWAGP